MKTGSLFLFRPMMEVSRRCVLLLLCVMERVIFDPSKKKKKETTWVLTGSRAVRDVLRFGHDVY